MQKKIITIAVLTAIFFIGCIPNLQDYPKEKCVSLPNDNVMKAIHDNCISCHKNDFTTKEDICVRKGLIINAVATGKMPKIGKLYDYYKAAIINWK